MPFVVLWRSGDVKNQVRRAGSRGVRAVAEHVLEESGRKVPHQTGTLERSGEVSVDEEKCVAAVSYGSTGQGGAASYAVKQHEDVTARHPNGREAKFFEKAVQLVAPNMMMTIIHGQVKEAFHE